ncbi:MAG: AIPR family protein [Candidatus Cloacimonetes bacterium]|nr:AIPR family protein [Candidatus Cloacimonadota bacterium]
MKEIDKFYQLLIQEIIALQAVSEEGDAQEQAFTRIAVDMLAEAGETENADIAYDEKDIGKKGQHKINAYAISDNYETVDLFISIFNSSDTIPIISKSEIEKATTRITNFFRKAITKKYSNDIAESSSIFMFANTLASFPELKERLIRVNAVVLTNGEYKGEFPSNCVINGYNVFYSVIDINHLYKISEQARLPIEIDFDDFEGERFNIPCLSADTDNQDYKAYIAIVPGLCLAKLYKKYGARLLEQNVRSFLQFTGKINRGIRDTIRNEPHMFFAFNNGLAATADHIELDESGRYIKKVNNLQIVNGGQTMASIFNTAEKDGEGIDEILVQIKFSIIKNPEQYSTIVSRISRYANTQNKVNDADFSANNPVLVAFEKLSRYVLTPITINKNMQTCWFFERARGQYKTLRNREGRTRSLQKAFDMKHPKSQMITKVELAKYINAYQEVYNNKKLVIGPHIVVRGNEKNYAQFIVNNIPNNTKKEVNNIYFEDAISKCILFKTAEKRYGTKLNDYNIGELRQVVVPYTIALISYISENKLDLYKIWKNQQLSPQLSDFIYDLMKQVNKFVLENSPISHYIEWAKKAECWESIKKNNWEINLIDISDDLVDDFNPPKRNINLDISEEEAIKNKELVRSIPPALWLKIGKWGKDSGYFDIKKQTLVSNIAWRLGKGKTLTDEEYRKGLELLDIVANKNEELLQAADDFLKTVHKKGDI